LSDNSGRSRANGIITALGIGALLGYLFAVVTRPEAGVAGWPSELSRTQSEPTTSLAVTVGTGRRDGSFTMFPVLLTNNTGADLSYAKVTCALYDKGGTLVASAFTNWTSVPAGGKVSGEVGSRAAGINSADCSATR
jgi:hypothetical protein